MLQDQRIALLERRIHELEVEKLRRERRQEQRQPSIMLYEPPPSGAELEVRKKNKKT